MVQAQGSGIFFNEGWESGSAAGSFNSAGFGSATGSSQFSVQNSVRASGTWAFRHALAAGQNGDSTHYATQHFGDAVNGPVWSNGRGQHFYDIYVQYRIQYSPGFRFDSHGYKMLEIGTEDNNDQTGVCCNPWVANYTTLYVGPTGNLGIEGNNKGSATAQWINYPQNAGGYSPSNPFNLQSGRWYTIEVRRRLNDAGVDNGILQMWVDGVLIIDHRNARIRVPRNGNYGANFTYGTNWVMISDYPANPVLQTQSVYYDEIKFSTAYIGGSGAGTPPSPPTNLRIVS